MRATVVASFAADALDPFANDDRHRDQRGYRISPPPPDERIQQQTTEENPREPVQIAVCFASAWSALLPIALATRRFARTRSGITTSETAARPIPTMLWAARRMSPTWETK